MAVRLVVSPTSYVSTDITLHKDFNISNVNEERKLAIQRYDVTRLANHPNPLGINLLDNSAVI